MKARHFKKLRRKIKDSDWLLDKLIYWGEKQKDNLHFKTFYCNAFFEGTALAEINTRKYLERRHLINRKIAQYYKFLNLLNP